MINLDEWERDQLLDNESRTNMAKHLLNMRYGWDIQHGPCTSLAALANRLTLPDVLIVSRRLTAHMRKTATGETE